MYERYFAKGATLARGLPFGPANGDIPTAAVMRRVVPKVVRSTLRKARKWAESAEEMVLQPLHDRHISQRGTSRAKQNLHSLGSRRLPV